MGTPNTHGSRPTLPVEHLKARREPQGAAEGIGAYRFRVQWVAAYDAFLAEVGSIAPEKEQAILRIFADAQENFAAINAEGDELGWNAVTRPSEENEQKYENFLEYGIPLLTDVRIESEKRLHSLLDEREWRAYRRHLWPSQIYFALKRSQPIE